MEAGSIVRGRVRCPVDVFFPGIIVGALSILSVIQSLLKHEPLEWSLWIGFGIFMLLGLWKYNFLVGREKRDARELVGDLHRALIEAF